MIYIKSLLMGSAAFCIVAVVFTGLRLWMAIRSLRASGTQGGVVGIDVLILMKSLPFWILTAGGFVAGFLWQFRREG